MKQHKCPKLIAAQQSSDDNLTLIFNVAAGNRAENKEMFLKTHTDIQLFDKKWNMVFEDDVFANFDYNYPGNQVVVIEGETGTGKSEVCVRLVYMLEENNWEIIHIHKNMDLPAMILALMDFYEEVSGQIHPEKIDMEKMRSQLSDEYKRIAIAKQIVGKFLEEILKQDYKRDIKRSIHEFEELFTKKIGNIVRSQGMTDYQAQFFTHNDLKTARSLSEIVNIINLNETDKTLSAIEFNSTLDFINNRLWGYIVEHFKAPTIDKIMDSISHIMRKQSKRVVMVIEDLKIATLDLRKILRYMERDRKSDRWDFLIAGTTDVIDIVKEEATRDDRFIFYRTNKEEDKVLFLGPENAVDFATKYLNFLYQRFRDQCKTCNKCTSEEIRELFPYNNSFLKNLFTRIVDKKPRTYIMKLYYGIQHFLKTEEMPTNSNEITVMRKPFLDLTSEIIDERINRFISYYSESFNSEENECYRIAEDYLEIFDLDIEDIPGSIIKDGFLILHVKNKNTLIELPTISKEEEIMVAQKSANAFEAISVLEKKYDIHLESISPWSASTSTKLSNEYLQINSFFKIGIKEILNILTNEFSLNENSSFSYKYGVNEYPYIHISEKITNSSLLQMKIDPKTFPEAILRRIILLGIMIDGKLLKLDNKEKLEICKDGLPLLLNLSLFWSQKFNDHIFNELLKTQRTSKTFSEEKQIRNIISSFVSFVLKIANPIGAFLPKEIISVFDNKETKDEFIANLIRNCNYLDFKDKSKLKEIKNSAEKLLSLYVEFISDNSNLQLIEDMCDTIEYAEYDTLREVTKNNLSKFDNKINFKKVEMGKILLSIKDLHFEIDRGKKKEYIDKNIIRNLKRNLDRVIINETLKVLKKNETHFYALETATRNNIRKLQKFYSSKSIDQIIEFLNLIDQRMFFNIEDDDETITEFQFDLEEYITWKWLCNNEILKVLDFLLNKDTVRDIEETSRTIEKIQELVEDIIIVYNRFT